MSTCGLEGLIHGCGPSGTQFDPPKPLHPRMGFGIPGPQIAVAGVLRCLIPGPNFLCSLPHPLVCGPLSHADLQVQTHADLECLLHLCSMRHADREISCCSCSARMQGRKEDFKSAASTIPPCPRASCGNAFRGFISAGSHDFVQTLQTCSPFCEPINASPSYGATSRRVCKS